MQRETPVTSERAAPRRGTPAPSRFGTRAGAPGASSDRQRGRRSPRGAARSERHASAALLLLLGTLAACARPVPPPAPVPTGTAFAPDGTLQARIDPRPTAHGLAWLGADVAASMPLGDGRAVWLFGDTLLGTVRIDCPDRAPYCDRVADDDAFIANSIGIMPAGGPIAFAWRQQDGEAAPVFRADAPDEILWPLAVVRLGDRLVIAANRHTRSAGLAPVGNTYLVVADARGPPARWTVTRHAVPGVVALDDPERALTWTTALVPDGPHLYVVGQRGVGFYARTVLARLALDQVGRDDWRPAPEYLLDADSAGTTWSRTLDVERLHEVVGLPGTTEATLERHPTLGWLTYRLAPFGDVIHQYSAAAIEGPWHDDGVAYRLPAPWSGQCHAPAPSCPGQGWIAYGVKSHPELAAPGSVVLTYNVNLLQEHGGASARLLRDVRGFYVPQVVTGSPLPARR